MSRIHHFRLAACLCLGVATTACSTLGPARDPGVHMLMGEVAAERGEFERAAHEYRLAAATSGDAKIAERAARLAFDNGQDRELERIAHEWLARDPKSEVALRFNAVALLQLDRRAEAAAEFARIVDSAYPSPAEAFTALNESLGDLRNDRAREGRIGSASGDCACRPASSRSQGGQCRIRCSPGRKGFGKAGGQAVSKAQANAVTGVRDAYQGRRTKSTAKRLGRRQRSVTDFAKLRSSAWRATR